MTLYRATRYGPVAMTAEEEAEFLADTTATIVPQEITIRQAVLALREAGYLTAVETWVATLDGELEIYWKRSQTVRRDHAFVESARVELGLTQQQMDQLFILAATKEP